MWYEAVCVSGLEAFVEGEIARLTAVPAERSAPPARSSRAPLRQLAGRSGRSRSANEPAASVNAGGHGRSGWWGAGPAYQFFWSGEPKRLLELTTVQAVYRLHHLLIPRPRALLGDAHFRMLIGLIETIRSQYPQPEAFATLELSAAGGETVVMERLKREIAQATGLTVADEKGDLLLRLRRPAAGGEGWEVLMRLSPRPLAVRAWRACNWPGALNATIARVMVQMSQPSVNDIFLNLACGSGTLLIERQLAAPARRIIGCDLDGDARTCALANFTAAGLVGRLECHAWDARAVPLPDRSVDIVVADLPFGHLVGSHANNLTLYPAILAEAARLTRPGGQAIVISQEARLLERTVAAQPEWQVERSLRLQHGQLTPRLIQLRRRGEPLTEE